MARTSSIVTVGKRKIELSNLKKVLFPSDEIVKAELIEYYLKVAPTILRHIKGRPLTYAGPTVSTIKLSFKKTGPSGRRRGSST